MAVELVELVDGTWELSWADDCLSPVPEPSGSELSMLPSISRSSVDFSSMYFFPTSVLENARPPDSTCSTRTRSAVWNRCHRESWASLHYNRRNFQFVPISISRDSFWFINSAWSAQVDNSIKSRVNCISFCLLWSNFSLTEEYSVCWTNYGTALLIRWIQ